MTTSDKPAQPEAYAFCESITGIGPWHIRKLTERGMKLGGGIDTPSLCGLVLPFGQLDEHGRRGCGGWDLNVRMHEYHLSQACPGCAEKYREATR